MPRENRKYDDSPTHGWHSGAPSSTYTKGSPAWHQAYIRENMDTGSGGGCASLIVIGAAALGLLAAGGHWVLRALL
jgi:hypothetical protein